MCCGGIRLCRKRGHLHTQELKGDPQSPDWQQKTKGIEAMSRGKDDADADTSHI